MGVAEESQDHREELAKGQAEREQLLSRTQALEGQVADLEAKLKQALEDTAAARSAADAARLETEGARNEMAQALDRSQNAKSEAQSLRERIDKMLDEHSSRRRARFLQAMRGKRSGQLEIISVAGSEQSKKIALELGALLNEAGWSQVKVSESEFRVRPPETYFVVHSQESMAEYAAGLALGLAIVDLMAVPAKVRANRSRPTGYLGLVVGTESGRQ